jgi:alpha-glucosidase (family GH31 glycosyl hydrolase)
MRALLGLIILLAVAAPARADPLTVTTSPDITIRDSAGRTVFSGGRIEVRRLGLWSAGPAPAVTQVADGVAHLEVTAAGAEAVRLSFDAAPGERFLGFGERSDAVVRTAGDVDNRVTEGPYQDIEDPFVRGFVPVPGQSDRPDATYFPIPWLLSSRGAGLLVTDDGHSVFRLGAPWSVEVDGIHLGFDVFAGPTPAAALRRFTARVGRQPPAAAPFYFGPWWQPKGDEAANLKLLREHHAAGSVVQTYTHYLPCGDQVTARERARTERFHAAGLAVTTYFNPMVCTSHTARYDPAVEQDALTKNALGQPYTYRYTGSSTFFVAQYDFTSEAGRRLYADALDEAVRDGYDGWMEDFGEYTPDDARAADGSTGAAGHNRYVVDYHATAHAYARERAGKPLARFNRSGWTGAARHSQIVWGGDPTTSWGFDGLTSAVRNGLSMGLSGVSLWGSDIGGFFALSQAQTSPELMRRWIEFGFASGVMRMQANGFTLRPSTRAQIFDKDVLPTWVRYARLRTQLYPYLARAQRAYDRRGMPLMRQLALAYPDDPKAVARDDEYLLGPDLLVAPVLEPGATTRKLYLPRGRWTDFWRRRTVLRGPGEVTVPAPLGRLPLLVRVGARIPLLSRRVESLYKRRPAELRPRSLLVATRGRLRVKRIGRRAS